MRHLRNVLDGAVSIFDSFSTDRPYVTNLGGFSEDSKNLAKDVRNFASDFRKQSDTVYVEATSRTRKKRKRR